MRTADKVYFVTRGTSLYDESTGSYIDTTPVKVEVTALVTDTGTERMSLLYGGIRQRAKTIRLNQKYVDSYDYVEINGEEYQVDLVRSYRQKMTLEVSGV